MRPAELQTLLRRVRRGAVSTGEAARADRQASPLERLGVRHARPRARAAIGFPRWCSAQGKTPSQLVAILGRLYARERRRARDAGRRRRAARRMPLRLSGRRDATSAARAVVLRRSARAPREAGARACAPAPRIFRWPRRRSSRRGCMGSRARAHRRTSASPGSTALLSHRGELRAARVIVVVAGLEARCRAWSAASSTAR